MRPLWPVDIKDQKDVDDDKTDDVISNDPQLMDDDDLVKCDVYELFNALQFGSYGNGFIDIRPQDEYKKITTLEAINVPYNIINDNDCNNKLKDVLKKMDLKNIITLSKIYCFSNKQLIANKNDIKFYKYFNSLNITKNIKIIILNTDFTTFASKFPYLCYNPNSNAYNIGMQLKHRRKYPNHILNDELYLGSMTAATTKNILINLKITHILNMTMQHNEFDYDDDLNLKYLNCPLWDADDEPIQNYFEKCIDFIHNALKQNKNNNIINKHRVLVHCQAGVSRSSTIVIAYLMKIHKMKYIDAYKYTQKRRQIIEPNDGFVEQLKEYEKNGFVVQKKNKFVSANVQQDIGIYSNYL